MTSTTARNSFQFLTRESSISGQNHAHQTGIGKRGPENKCVKGPQLGERGGSARANTGDFCPCDVPLIRDAGERLRYPRKWTSKDEVVTFRIAPSLDEPKPKFDILQFGSACIRLTISKNGRLCRRCHTEKKRCQQDDSSSSPCLPQEPLSL